MLTNPDHYVIIIIERERDREDKIMNNKKLYFDLDGTLADLYNEVNWLERLLNKEEGLFKTLKPLYDLEELNRVIGNLALDGWTIGVITWLPMGATPEYEEQVRKEKQEWIDNNLCAIDEIHFQSYGTPKHSVVKGTRTSVVLVDDNAEVREQWITPKQRVAIDATKNILIELNKLLQR